MTSIFVFVILGWEIWISSWKPEDFRENVAKRGCMPALFGWASAVLFITVVPLVGEWHSNFVDVLIPILLWSTLFTGIVALPTFLLTASLIARLLPPASPLWKPHFAAAVGAIAGPFALYLWFAGLLGKIFVPDFHEGEALILGGASVVAGAVFAFSFARRKQP